MIKSKVVSLELAKRMKKLGWKKETLFQWWQLPIAKQWVIQYFKSYSEKPLNAPLFCEIWEELPEEIQEPEGGDYLTKVLYEDNSIAYTQPLLLSLPICKLTFTNISDLIQENAGNLWCWLKENGYIGEAQNEMEN